MAEYNIEMNVYDQANLDFNQLYPKTKVGLVDGLGASVICTITPAIQGVTMTLAKGTTTYSGISNVGGIITILVTELGTYNITFSDPNIIITNSTIDLFSYGIYNIDALKVVTYSVIIDENNSNPLTALTYADDAIGMIKGSSDWDVMPIFKDIKPCLLTSNSGVPAVTYLNPNNFAQYVDGSSADITSGNSGDVMIEFKNKWGFKLERTGTNLKISVTDNPNASGYSYKHFSRGTEGDKNAFYVGAYHGYLNGSDLTSLSGKTPSANYNIGNAITYCSNRGTGYKLWAFDILTALQCLYIIKYGNLDSRSALGMGYVGASSARTTGGTNSNGMYYGTSSSTQQIKLFGIEDFWGNVYDWIGGLYSDANRHILTAFNNFNTTGSGYTDNGQGATSNINGYMTQSQGSNGSGFVLKIPNGSSSTYYCDVASLYASRLPRFGGYWSDGAYAGAFQLNVDFSASDADASVGARLSYC